jgi:hypothetical protein
LKTEKPILMSGSNVRAILEDRKRQTRRAFKPPRALAECCKNPNRLHVPHNDNAGMYPYMRVDHCESCGGAGGRFECPYGKPGDRLWVKETFQTGDYAQNEPRGAVYRATDPDWGATPEWKWKPSIFMPRRLSRITLEIVKVRLERLQEISEADAWAEGCKRGEPTANGGWFPAEERHPSGKFTTGWDNARDWYADLWEDINGEGSWDLNPFVWVVEFERV